MRVESGKSYMVRWNTVTHDGHEIGGVFEGVARGVEPHGFIIAEPVVVFDVAGVRRNVARSAIIRLEAL